MPTAPSTRNRARMWLLYAGIWTLVGLFWATRWYWLFKDSKTMPITWLESMCLGLVEWYLWGFFALAIFAISSRLPFQKSRWWRPLPIHAVCALVISLVQLLLYNAAQRPIDEYFMQQPPPPEMATFWSGYFYILRSKLHAAVMAYALIAMVSYAILYYRRYRQQELQAAELSTQLAHARLDALQSRLQPHFLFNTLHTISSLMHEDVAAADLMVSRLSGLLRLVLHHADRPTIALRRELEFVEAYLDIERVRFSDRLRVVVDVDAAALDVPVPTLMLQPLVENAVRHGVAAATDGGTVRVGARLDNGYLLVSVSDNGPGLGSRSTGGSGRGIGLASVRERLQSLYGEDHIFTLSNSEAGVSVSIRIPCQSVDPAGVRNDEGPDRR
ncbi:MAG: sensor histidine kinase [Candidatus Zixiibacteriota bacterium]